jgi:hypothetical protein
VADILSQAGGPPRSLLDRLPGLAPERRIAGRNGTKADVLFFDREGWRIALKTYAPRGALVRATLGRWLVAREAAAYAAAAGSGFLPSCFGRPEPWSLATCWVPGEPLRSLAGGRADPAVFDRLAAALEELHGRGVALGDLHHRDVLVAADGTVRVVDLATAWVLGPRPGALRRLIFRRLAEADRVNLARMRARFTGGDPAAAAASVSPAAAAWHRRGRRLKAAFDRLRGRARG